MTVRGVTKPKYRIPKKRDVVKEKIINNRPLTKEQEKLNMVMVLEYMKKLNDDKKIRQKAILDRRRPFQRLVMLMRLSHDELVFDLEEGEILE